MLFLLSYKGAGCHNRRSHNRNDKEKYRKDIVEDQMEQGKARITSPGLLGKKLQHCLDVRVLRYKICGQNKNTGKEQGKKQRNDQKRDKKPAIGRNAV